VGHGDPIGLVFRAGAASSRHAVATERRPDLADMARDGVRAPKRAIFDLRRSYRPRTCRATARREGRRRCGDVFLARRRGSLAVPDR
jgi:hypothetical protein